MIWFYMYSMMGTYYYCHDLSGTSAESAHCGQCDLVRCNPRLGLVSYLYGTVGAGNMTTYWIFDILLPP